MSRLGNPLINEVIIPRAKKDYWNSQPPSKDSQFTKYYEKPELAGLINLLYPALPDAGTTGRTDLSLILLHGVPTVNNTGKVAADELRLNTGVPACAADSPNPGRFVPLDRRLLHPAPMRSPISRPGRTAAASATTWSTWRSGAVAEGYGPLLHSLFPTVLRT